MCNRKTHRWVGMVHPDLGIGIVFIVFVYTIPTISTGGAERLIVDIALQLALHNDVCSTSHIRIDIHK